MSPLNFFLPGWTTLGAPIPDEPTTEAQPVSDSEDWSADASNDNAERRYAEYCDKKYDDATHYNRLADDQIRK